MGETRDIAIAVIGASGYTGADLIRLALGHPRMRIAALVAKTHAGRPMGEVFPHLAGRGLPDLVSEDAVSWDDIDAVFCGLPHGTAQDVIARLPDHLRIIDMSADFRLRDATVYAQWYGRDHGAPALLAEAAYGLTEHNRDAIARARLVACPGCYPTAALLALLPLVKAGAIEADDIIIDAKSGTSGAGRSPKQAMLFAEVGEGLSPYGVARHRHAPEIEQELGQAAGRSLVVNFTPHLVPMSRGELVSCYVRLAEGMEASHLRAILAEAYDSEPFVRLLPEGRIPATQYVRGSNDCHIAVFADRVPGRAMVFSALDNLVKGSAGQAVQNFNLMFGLPETLGLTQAPLFP